MSRKKVLISNLMMLNERQRFERILLESNIDPVFPEVFQCMTYEQCHFYAGKIDGWLAGDDPIDQKVLEAHKPRLKIISKWGTGLDSIDLEAAEIMGIKVTNTAGAFDEAVGEIAVGYIISLVREIIATHNSVLGGAWPKNQHISLGARRIGIIGYGAIGSGIASRLRGLCPNVYFYDVNKQNDPSNFANFTELSWLRDNCDIIVLSCQLNSNTHHLIDTKFLRKMQPGSFLVNVSRGPIIDQEALIANLQAGHISGAALDVFEIEPLEKENELKNLNVILGSHNANNTQQAVEAVHDNTLKNLLENL